MTVRRNVVHGLIRLARPTDWLKNLFVFPALIASGLALDPGAAGSAVVAFIAFCLTASGVYAINDVVDRRNDALHPVKRFRPVPSGEVSPATATTFGVLSIVFGLTIGFVFGLPELTFVLLIYLALQAIYTGGLKRIAVLDVALLAFGFVLRAFAGAVVIDAPASLWMLATVFFLCLYLAQIKRLCDLRSADAARAAVPAADMTTGTNALTPALSAGSGSTWTSPAGYRSGQELTLMLSLSAALAVGTLLAYGLSEHARNVVGPGVLAIPALTPLAVVVILRFHRIAIEGRSDSPIAIALADPVILGCGIAFLAGAVIAVYVPQVGDLLAHYFLVESDVMSSSGISDGSIPAP